MKFPSLYDYQSAVQNPGIAFARDPVLASGRTRMNGMGMPLVASGGVAATFRVDASGQTWAVRCFHRQETHDRRLLERYRHISDFVASDPELDFLVPVSYEQNSVLVNGTSYPTVRMPWVDGEPLGIWLEDWVDQPNPDRNEIEQVRSNIASAVSELRNRGAAHGDLQHGNILVRPDRSIWLIDYDGAYLPSLSSGFGAIEQGHRNYQHPGRADHYDADLDLFSAAVIDLSLSALGRDPGLWERLAGTGENILFSSTDFVAPRRSRAFQSVSAIPGLESLLQALLRACETGYPHIGDALSGKAVPSAAVPVAVRRELVVHALDTERLRRLQGQVVTVFGTVRSARFIRRGKTGQPHILINLGDYRKAELTFVVFGDDARTLYNRYGGRMSDRGTGYVPGMNRLKVVASGPVTLYHGRYSDDPVPQIELRRASMLRIIDSQRYQAYQDDARRGGNPVEPASRTRTKPNSTASSVPPHTSVPHSPPQDWQKSLSDFYAAPRFGSPSNFTSPSSSTSSTPPPFPSPRVSAARTPPTRRYKVPAKFPGPPPLSYSRQSGSRRSGGDRRALIGIIVWSLVAVVLLIMILTGLSI